MLRHLSNTCEHLAKRTSGCRNLHSHLPAHQRPAIESAAAKSACRSPIGHSADGYVRQYDARAGTVTTRGVNMKQIVLFTCLTRSTPASVGFLEGNKGSCPRTTLTRS